jgi:hypothetical protein
MPIVDPDVPKGMPMPKNCKFKEVRVGFFTRFLLVFFPHWGVRRLTKECGFLTPDMCWKLHDVLASVGRIDVVPSRSGFRGFSIVFDNLFALYFNQDGDHFTYDGYEFGDYDNGDVTVFDA